MSGVMDKHGNTIAREGIDRCLCDGKYWDADRCIACGTHVLKVREVPGQRPPT